MKARWQPPSNPAAACNFRSTPQKNNGGLADRRAYGSSVHEPHQPILDQVDFGREIARDLEANFLLTHGRLRPNLHDVSSIENLPYLGADVL